jgi:hypothetical protein
MSWNWIIDDKYRITSNDKQYFIQKSFQSKDETIGWKNDGSYKDLSGVFSGLVEKGVRSEDVRNVADAQIALQKWAEKVADALRPDFVVGKKVT